MHMHNAHAQEIEGDEGSPLKKSFSRRRLSLASVDTTDLSKIATMADELDAGDW